jgi:hypothetical protein
MSFSVRRFVSPIAVLLAAIVTAPQLRGQSAMKTAPKPEGWLDRRTNLTKTSGLSAADHAIIDANMLFVEGLVRRISGYAKPRGFELGPWWSYAIQPDDPLKSYSTDFTVFIPSRAANPDGNGGFGILFNPNFRVIADVSVADEENGGTLYIERERSAPVHGSTITYGVFDVENTPEFRVLFTSNNELPMLAVTREEYLRAMIFTLEGKDQEKLKAHKAAFAKTPYETWMEGAAERRQIRETVVAGIADKAQAAKTRAELEASERKTTEAIKKDEPNFRDMAREAQKMAAPGDPFRAQLAAMSRAERASPAWLSLNDLVPPGTLGARAVIRENPAFYRKRPSPAAPRAIMVILPKLEEVAMGAQRQLERELDWAALKGRLDQRP